MGQIWILFCLIPEEWCCPNAFFVQQLDLVSREWPICRVTVLPRKMSSRYSLLSSFCISGFVLFFCCCLNLIHFVCVVDVLLFNFHVKLVLENWELFNKWYILLSSLTLRAKVNTESSTSSCLALVGLCLSIHKFFFLYLLPWYDMILML